MRHHPERPARGRGLGSGEALAAPPCAHAGAGGTRLLEEGAQAGNWVARGGPWSAGGGGQGGWSTGASGATAEGERRTCHVSPKATQGLRLHSREVGVVGWKDPLLAMRRLDGGQGGGGDTVWGSQRRLWDGEGAGGWRGRAWFTAGQEAAGGPTGSRWRVGRVGRKVWRREREGASSTSRHGPPRRNGLETQDAGHSGHPLP